MELREKRKRKKTLARRNLSSFFCSSSSLATSNFSGREGGRKEVDKKGKKRDRGWPEGKGEREREKRGDPSRMPTGKEEDEGRKRCRKGRKEPVSLSPTLTLSSKMWHSVLLSFHATMERRETFFSTLLEGEGCHPGLSNSISRSSSLLPDINSGETEIGDT